MIARPNYRLAAAVLILEGLLLFAPMAVLGAAIEWPASLDWPAADLLPRLLANEAQVRQGYLIYLAYSLLFWPVALLVSDVVAGGAQRGPLLRLALGFAVASTLARTIGILRWLTVMPGLAATYAAGGPEQSTVATVYTALNSYGGGIGELLGVSLFATLWLICISVAALRAGTLPRWLSVAGLVAAAALASPLVELLGLPSGPLVAVGSASLQLWLLAAGLTLALRRPAAITGVSAQARAQV
jgi:hypothetical protein